ncbi:MAG TPA: aminotransferase class V-fold PLP-dependent enzyme, partial [Bacillota bacterium]|nr:aminotransferase class V-fold PLP-dependent enzyme [Bacillota bacterium]
MIYLNQAATSYPKPKVVIDEMVRVLTSISGNPGRGEASHIRSASTILQETRENLKEVFGMSNARKAIFFENATVALNQAIKGVKWE